MGFVRSSASRHFTAQQVGSPDFAKTMIDGLLAGYVAARMAGSAPLLHGTLSSAACLATHAVPLPVLVTYPLWIAAAGIIVAPLAGFAGGWLASEPQRRLLPA
ncbi:MAG TPA: hypothetical protein VI056_00600 [Candidatus Limnocylindria bacterium]